MKTNMTADGWFHAATWVITLAGILRLWSAAGEDSGELPSTRAFVGLLLLGWGGFNLVEGIIDHHLLELHHVRDVPRHLPAYDWTFLAVGGVGLLLLGWVLQRRPAA
ncbi:MAG: hypothetical protein QOH06_6185 [Acidobacteriota bacterium]|jgi:uncharacterized membrane protein|nr:hypothetical protein [Acidobacteriota bacterium]